ncbi:hypothetical protein VNI00_015066 [Paramarasmius palmivorus]|uniref:FAD-binding domain-containing protein n=1 Tax=Paramarasmius palmivorus TaxID=297713 RepID=A0AAW0BPQ1_9AGAR
MSKQPDVLIAGAGPSGLALALLLCRNGLSVRVIDQRDDFNVGSRGAGMHARTLELYKLLGILPEVEKRSTKLPPRDVYIQGQDKPISQAPLVDELPSETRFYRINSRVFRQEEHQALLREVLQNEYGCIVELSTELEGFTQHDDSVLVNIAKQGRQETVQAKWLVGADGARSNVRKQLGLTFLGESDATISSVIGDIEIEALGDVDGTNWSFWGNMKEKTAGICPYDSRGRKMAFFLLSGPRMNTDEVGKSQENIISEFREITGRDDLVFGHSYTHAVWKSNVRMANKFQEGRVFVVGDAAHVHTPAGGQFNLAWKLALAHKGLSPHSLVESYTTERVPLIATMLNLTKDIMRKARSGNASFRTLQHGFETRQLGITYRGTSSFFVDERYPIMDEEVDLYRSGLDGTVRAGDRAPEAPGLKRSASDDEDSTSIYEFFDVTSHTVLLFGRSISEIQGFLDLLAKYPRGLVKTILTLPQGSVSQSYTTSVPNHVLVDTEGHAYTNYRVEPGHTLAIVVRPDGYIGAAAQSTAGLSSYFSKDLCVDVSLPVM